MSKTDIITIDSPSEWAAYCSQLREADLETSTGPETTIGFVPTMGALHRGHAELIRRSTRENDVTLLSIFVNPTQFNDTGDLAAYPRTIETDLELARELGVSAVYLPTPDSMYPDDFSYRLQETDRSTSMEGAHRPGHFDGVLTVVLKLLLLTRPRRAYFGQKDYQQYALIRGMAEAFFLRETAGTEIVACPTVREDSGLAFSSRNRQLTPTGLRTAARLYDILRTADSAEHAAQQLAAAGFAVEYVTDSSHLSPGSMRRFAAVKLEGVRLIDNIALNSNGGRHE